MGYAGGVGSGIQFDAVCRMERSRSYRGDQLHRQSVRLTPGVRQGETSSVGNCWRALLLAAGLALVPVGWLALPAPAVAQSLYTGDPIGDIRVEGTQRVEPETVR